MSWHPEAPLLQMSSFAFLAPEVWRDLCWQNSQHHISNSHLAGWLIKIPKSVHIVTRKLSVCGLSSWHMYVDLNFPGVNVPKSRAWTKRVEKSSSVQKSPSRVMSVSQRSQLVTNEVSPQTKLWLNNHCFVADSCKISHQQHKHNKVRPVISLYICVTVLLTELLFRQKVGYVPGSISCTLYLNEGLSSVCIHPHSPGTHSAILSRFREPAHTLSCWKQSMLIDLYLTRLLLHLSLPCLCDILGLSISVCQRVVKLISGITTNSCCVYHCKPLRAPINDRGNAPVHTLFPQVCVNRHSVCVCVFVCVCLCVCLFPWQINYSGSQRIKVSPGL